MAAEEQVAGVSAQKIRLVPSQQVMDVQGINTARVNVFYGQPYTPTPAGVAGCDAINQQNIATYGTTGRVRGMNSVARAGRPTDWRVRSLDGSGIGSDQVVGGHLVLQHIRCGLRDDNDS